MGGLSHSFPETKMERKRVLVIDDHYEILEMFGLFLRHFGYEPITAKTGRQGLEKAASSSPDLIILDLSLPDVSGLEVAKILKRNPKTAEIPIVIVTALVADSWKEPAKRVGISEVLSKPCSLDVFRRVVEQLVCADGISLDGQIKNGARRGGT
jgi:CheY-like chemotaxis protein